MIKEFLGMSIDSWYEVKRVVEEQFGGDIELFCEYFENPDITLKDLTLEIQILRNKIKRAEAVLR